MSLYLAGFLGTAEEEGIRTAVFDDKLRKPFLAMALIIRKKLTKLLLFPAPFATNITLRLVNLNPSFQPPLPLPDPESHDGFLLVNYIPISL